MRVRMKGTISGTRNGVDWPGVGGEIDLPDDEGAILCDNGMAEPVAVKPEPEKAVKPEPEKRDGDLNKRAGVERAAERGTRKGNKRGPADAG